MDLLKILEELYAERDRLNKMIGTLENLDRKNLSPPGRRGRKFMDPAGRREVSERMKKYWAARRAQSSGSAAE